MHHTHSLLKLMKLMKMKYIVVVQIGLASALLAITGNARASDSSDALAQITGASFEFRHPGALNDLAELQKIRAHIEAGEEPWTSNFAKLEASRFAQADYQAHPSAVVSLGATEINEIDDAVAAYAQALLWVLTGEEWHAQKSAEIIDVWSRQLRSYTGLGWYLEPAWTAAPLAEAAEILRATYPQWRGAPTLAKVFNDVFLPILHNRMAFGNREFAVCNALVAIGVFNEDRAAFYEGINHWLSYVPSYFYIEQDGPQAIKPDYWLTSPSDAYLLELNQGRKYAAQASWSWIHIAQGVESQGDDKTVLTQWSVVEQWQYPGTFLAGYTPETGGRDLGHTENAFLSAVNVAEIAWHQGIDLYSIAADRLKVFMEVTAGIRLGEPISPAAYNGQLNMGNGLSQTYEIAYNHLHNVLGIPLPKTQQLINVAIRQMGPKPIPRPFPSPIPASLAAPLIWAQAGWTANWETLTHADLDLPN
jgi:hypothetical protein